VELLRLAPFITPTLWADPAGRIAGRFRRIRRLWGSPVSLIASDLGVRQRRSKDFRLGRRPRRPGLTKLSCPV